MKLKIVAYGTQALVEDAVAFRVAELLNARGYGVQLANNPQDALDELSAGRGLVIIDAAEGVAKPELITDIGQLGRDVTSTTHDMDLSFFLALTESMQPGITKNLSIIALPIDGQPQDMVEEVERILNSIEYKQ